VVGTKLQV
jgi:hypothetical protein